MTVSSLRSGCDRIGDPLEQARLVHHVGDLGKDDARSVLPLLELGAGADDQLTPAGHVG